LCGLSRAWGTKKTIGREATSSSRHDLPPHRRLTVPDHKALAKGTLRAVIRQAGLTVEEFVDLVR